MCPGQPEVWAFAIQRFPPAWLELMGQVHPGTAFPGHSADNLPPALKEAAALASSLQALRQPVLRPAADGDAPAAAAAAPTAAAVAEEEEDEGEEDWDAVLSSGGYSGYCELDFESGCSCGACRAERAAELGSLRLAPGKKVSWSAAIPTAGEVLR